jgi:NTF2-related export protein 1/2
MSLPTPDAGVKASSEAAQYFLDAYYEALNRRQKLDSFYVNSCSQYRSAKADISINGARQDTPADFQILLETQGHGVHYEVESFDAHTINPNFNMDAPDHLLGPDKTGAKSSILVNVLGRVQYGRTKDAAQQNFTEVFVLVPNWETFNQDAPRNLKRRLILSQNFRAL